MIRSTVKDIPHTPITPARGYCSQIEFKIGRCDARLPEHQLQPSGLPPNPSTSPRHPYTAECLRGQQPLLLSSSRCLPISHSELLSLLVSHDTLRSRFSQWRQQRGHPHTLSAMAARLVSRARLRFPMRTYRHSNNAQTDS